MSKVSLLDVLRFKSHAIPSSCQSVLSILFWTLLTFWNISVCMCVCIYVCVCACIWVCVCMCILCMRKIQTNYTREWLMGGRKVIIFSFLKDRVAKTLSSIFQPRIKYLPPKYSTIKANDRKSCKSKVWNRWTTILTVL